MQNLYKLHYPLDEVEPNIQKVLEFINTPLDISSPTVLLEKREEGRLLLPVASKCFLTIDYHYRRQGSRTGEDYSLYASMREYMEMCKKDLENSLMSIANTINYYKQER